MRALPVLVLVSLAALTASAGLLDEATIEFDASPAGPAATAFTATCTVAVGQTLASALSEAVDDGCIASIGWSYFSFGRFLDCVNGVCGRTAGDESRFWGLYENHVLALSGADDLTVDALDTFQLSYDNCRESLAWTCIPNWAVP
ncbi:MAG TPA: hypothetical protein VI997_11825 [Candidatus Thermoplasmatota archaeon]|nr:hypothetical protein [Candidatus Thermoplasmatota archaeon]